MLLPLLLACVYDEGLPEVDIYGKVIIPAAAATRDVVSVSDGPDDDGDGNPDPVYTVTEDVTDVRLLGPVYLGAFSGMDTVSFDYPHPTMGPIITSEYPGNTFPFGGTSLGRLDFACYEALKCRVTTDRFTDWANVIDYFTNVLGTPILDDLGRVVDDPVVFQQYCYEYFHMTSDAEMSFLGEPGFTVNDDGDFEAEFVMPHTVFNAGMVIWGWMDSPQLGTDAVDANGAYSTCEQSIGRNYTEYDEDYYEGAASYIALNYPSFYLYDGDWVSEGVTMDAETDEPVVTLDWWLPEAE